MVAALWVVSTILVTLPWGFQRDDPCRYVRLKSGDLLSVGTCDSAVGVIQKTKEAPLLSRQLVLPREVLLRITNCPYPFILTKQECDDRTRSQDNVFRQYAAGRMAFKNLNTGQIRVSFDKPRLAPLYSRLHSCAYNDSLYYLTTHPVLDPRSPVGFGGRRLSFKLLETMPIQGSQEAGSNIIRSELWNIIHSSAYSPAGFMMLKDVTSKTFLKTHFDFAYIGEMAARFYFLESGVLRESHYHFYYDSSNPGDANTLWHKLVNQEYKTDLSGPFWIVQVVPEYFIAIQRDGRVVLFMSKTEDQPQKVIQLFRKGKNVKIIHDGDEASVESDSYKFRVTPTGIHLPVANEPQP